MNTEITSEEITQAVDTLTQNGEKVNSHSVRKLLGRGSYTTIGAFLKAKLQNDCEPFPDQLPAMPEQMMGIVSNAASIMWKDALKYVYEKYKKAIDDAKKSISSIESRIGDVDEEIKQLKEKILSLQQQLLKERDDHAHALDKCKYDISTLQSSEGQLRGESSVLKEQNAALLNQISSLQQMLAVSGSSVKTPDDPQEKTEKPAKK